MLTFDEICELVRLVGETGVAGLEIEQSNERIRIEGRPTESTAAASVHPPVPLPVPVQASAEPAPTSAQGDEVEDEGLHIVASPIVGTFYSAPNPDAAPYVAIGDSVKKGQSLCIVEAMKLMNEIEADVTGIIARIYPENGQPVEFGERLFAIRLG